jgi:hypothetical protein
MIMSGYSSGVPTGFLACGMESQMDAGLRHIKGYVPIDYAILTDNPDFAGFSEADLMTQQASYDAGTYQAPIAFALVGNLARTDPEGDSPLIPGLTNFQVAMFYGAGPFIPNVTFHYFAGVWEDDSPISLQYVTLEQFYDFMESAIPYQPVKFFIDYQSMAAGEDTPFDDHYGDISVPILNVSPAGGFGELSKYQYTVVGSTDVTHLIPALRPAGEEHLDFGHIDIFMANNAESVIWEDLLDVGECAVVFSIFLLPRPAKGGARKPFFSPSAPALFPAKTVKSFSRISALKKRAFLKNPLIYF